MYVPLPAQQPGATVCSAIEAERRRLLAIWQEHYDHIQRIKPRTDEERIAQAEALELLKQAHPSENGQRN